MNRAPIRSSIWQDVIAWLKKADAALPLAWPPELPSEKEPNFWFTACKLEMATRNTITTKLRALIAGSESVPMSPLEAWLSRRRFEWAGQVALAQVMEGNEPQSSLPVVLEWVLVNTWQSDGCIGMWNHAERGGLPHPENKDGLKPI